MKQRIYLDHNATTPLRSEALEAMMPFLTERFGNASSLHAYGREARDAVESAREVVANAIGAHPSEIVFTSGGTESDNLALRGVLAAGRAVGKRHLVTTTVEHLAVLETAEALEREGIDVTYVGVDRFACVDPGAVREAIRPDTALVSVMHANNETGSVEPIAEIGAIARAHGVPFHTDAVQTVGKLPVDVDAMGIDLLSMSAHKFGGPKGVGALYVRRGTRIERLLTGGAHEANRRAGTENVAGIVGMATALALALDEMESEARRLRTLTTGFIETVRRRIDGVHLNSPEDRVPGTVHLSFEGVEGESLILGLDLEGICVSTGSACSSGSMEPSHVVRAIGLPPELAAGALRFSFGKGNTEAEVAVVVDVLERLVARARRPSRAALEGLSA